MRILRTYPGMSNSELARQAMVTRQAMNAVLHRLEEEGLISRPECGPRPVAACPPDPAR